MLNPVNDAKILNTALSKGGTREKLPLLPDREWVKAMIESVQYGQGEFNKAPQFLTDQNKEFILDGNGQKIPRMVFNITFILSGHTLNAKGDPRKAWLTVGASLNEKANLPKILQALGLPCEDVTPLQIINGLTGKKVMIQFSNKVDKDGEIWQNVIKDAIKKDTSETAAAQEQAQAEWDA